MKFFTLILLILVMFTLSCTDRTVYRDRVVYQDSAIDRDVPEAEPLPTEIYSNCYVPGRGFLGDDGYYYPRNTSYRCNGMIYYDGVRYTRPINTLMGAMALGYYYGSAGPGYGHYGRYHSNVVNVKNVTVIKRGSPEYTKNMSRYKSIQTKRNKNKWVSQSERKRRRIQSQRDKAAHRAKMKAQNKSSGGWFSKKSKRPQQNSNSWSSNSYKKKTYKSSSRSSNNSWSRRSKRATRRKSDARLKVNVATIKDAMNKVKQMRGVYFDYKQKYDLDLPYGRQVGVIAQEVKKVFPETVNVGAEGFYEVNYDLLVAVLIQAIKEQQKQIDDLELDVMYLLYQEKYGEK